MQPEIIEIDDSKTIYNDVVYLLFRGSNFKGVFNPKDPAIKKFLGSEYTNDFLMDKSQPKFFVQFAYQFGHFFTDTLSPILLKIEQDKLENKKTALIFPPMSPDDVFNRTGAIHVISYISKYFSNNGIEVVKSPELKSYDQVTLIKVRNLEFQSIVSFNAWSMKKVRDFLRSLPEVQDLRGPRKIYLSREKTNDSNKVLFSELGAIRANENCFPPNYLRVSNESDVTKFLEEKADIEKIIPEEIDTFEDQIRLFSDASMLISTTSSSLFNMLFMPEDSTVIELVTPLTVWDSRRDSFVTSFHNHYSLLSFICGINYIGLPHNRDAEQVIDKLDRYMF